MGSVSDLPVIGRYLETEHTLEAGAGIGNYNKLGYGFCVFCDPSKADGGCKTDFEAYKAGNPVDNYFDFIGRLADSGEYKTVEEYAHQGLDKTQCTYASMLSLLVYLYWFLWQLHYTLVVKAYWEQGKFVNEQK